MITHVCYTHGDEVASDPVPMAGSNKVDFNLFTCLVVGLITTMTAGFVD